MGFKKNERQKDNKKKLDDNTDALTKENLEKEIQKYLKTNQDIEDPEELDPEDIKLLNTKNEERQNEYKKIIDEKNMDNLLKFCLTTVSETSKDELKMVCTKKSIEEYGKK